jgi:polysaccharide biosynthesis/export protein
MNHRSIFKHLIFVANASLTRLVLFTVIAASGFLPGAFCSRVLAQENNQASPIARVAASTLNDDTRYRIGPGDVLTILVRKAAELSGPVRVDQRGMIRIPMFKEEIQAACRTESELAMEIRNIYLEYKKDPSVEVFVTEFQSRPVSVIGAIGSPGQFRLQRQVRLLELLTVSGGPAARAGRTIDIVHSATPNMCEKATEKKETDVADQISIYVLNDTLAGKPEANPFLRPGDIVHIPDADQVFIIGHVVSPQPISLRDKPITISRAIAMSGGPARDGKTSKIRIIRELPDGGGKQEIFVNLKDIEKLKAPDIALMANDIVEVPASTGKTILGLFSGAIGPTLSGTAVRALPGVP